MPGSAATAPRDGGPSDVRVKSVVSHWVLGIEPDASLDVALKEMAQAGVRHLPVVLKGRCLGLLHEADVLWHLWAHPGARVASIDCCRRPSPVVDIADYVARAAVVIDGAGTDAAVVTERGRVVGVITATDLVRLVASAAA